MRQQQAEPARQLNSAALRYRWPSGWSRSHLYRAPARVPEGAARPAAPAADEHLCRDARLQRIEAVLFLAREPLSTRKLSELANLADGTEARTLVRRLNRLYDECGRAFRVEEVAGGLQLLCRRKFAAWLRRLEHVPGELRLSPPAIETLAVIAYRQPALRADIEAIRGVNCGEILRQLMDRDLVRISGRSEELGRPYLYSTTKKFLQLFGLPNIDKLPRVETMRNVSGDVNRPEESRAGIGPEQDTEAGHDLPTARPQPHQSHEKKESEVIVTSNAVVSPEEGLEDAALRLVPAIALQAKDDEDFEDFSEEEELDDDDDDEEDEDYEFDEEDEEEEEFEEEFDEEEDFAEDDGEDEDEDEAEEEFDEEEEEWEEVEDEEEEDEDWDEEDDDMDWDDEEEEEEEEEEEWD